MDIISLYIRLSSGMATANPSPAVSGLSEPRLTFLSKVELGVNDTGGF